MKATVKMTGPFFEHDPERTFKANCSDLLYSMANEGRLRVIGELKGGESGRKPIRKLGDDRVSDHVKAGMIARHPAPPIAFIVTDSKGLGTDEAISLMAAASSVEGRSHAFRRAAGWLRRSREVNYAELLKGIQ